jgi:hypothetical protein
MANTHTPMTADRKTTLAAGLFYIATFVFSIPALAFFDDVLNDPNFVHGSGGDGGVLWGALFDVLTGLTGIGAAVALYSVIRRYGPANAIGFVASRTLEAAAIFAGVMAVLGVYTLRQDFAGTDAAGLTTAAHGLVAVKDWSFLLGPGIMPAINALCLATVLYRTGLVPRIIPTLGLIGAPLLLVFSTGALFGAWEQVSGAGMLMALPIAAWEFSLGVYMAVKGFRTPEVTTSDDTVMPAAAVSTALTPAQA